MEKGKRRIGNKFRELYTFSEGIQLSFAGGKTQFKTKVEAFFTVLMVVSVLAYALTKAVSLVKRDQVTITMDRLEGYYDPKTEY